MKILLIGDFSDQYDEGLKNISKKFYHELNKNNEVNIINIKKINLIEFLLILVKFKPKVIHYFTGPTFFSFIFLKLLKLRWVTTKTVISALHPKSPEFLKNKIYWYIICSLFKPDIILYQDKKDQFAGISEKLYYFPNGVDIEKFCPVSKQQKIDLKIKYSLDFNKYVILHVGHVIRKRNLEVFQKIQETVPNVQTLIVGGTYLNIDEKIKSNLEKSGCIIKIGYCPNIHEIYALADCYIFPVKWGNTINIPLTVLEAMATNLPVIAIKYPTLQQFTKCIGLNLVETDEQIIHALKKMVTSLQNNEAINTRNCILQYSWSKLTANLETNIYNTSRV